MSSSSSPSSSSSASSGVVAGTWKRLFEEEPIGNTEGADKTTLVLWTQSRDCGIYIDIRIPIDSPGRSLEAAQQVGIQSRPCALAATGFGDHAKAKLRDKLDILLQQKSFAGVINVKPGDTTQTGQALKQDKILAQLVKDAAAESSGPSSSACIALCTCFWRRDLDYQPPTLDLDIGVCASSEPPSNKKDGSIILRETGADGSYAEGWLRLPQTEKGPFTALELLAENDIVGARKGYWVQTGSWFAYAVGRPMSSEFTRELLCAEQSDSIQKCIGKSLSEAIESTAPGGTRTGASADRMLDLLGSYVCAAGEIDDTGKWKIHHSTNPELVGCLLVGKASDDHCCSQLVPMAQTPTGGESSSSSPLGEEVEQLITHGKGQPPVKRRWKVVELTGCSLPTS